MPAREEVLKLLEDCGATLERHANHLVYRLPSGRTYVIPNTPRDPHSWNNNLAVLRRLLGVHHGHDPARKTVKHRKPGRSGLQAWERLTPVRAELETDTGGKPDPSTDLRYFSMLFLAGMRKEGQGR